MKVEDLMLPIPSYKSSNNNIPKWYFNVPTASFFIKLISLSIKGWYKSKVSVYDDFQWASDSVNIFKGLESVGAEINIYGLDNLTKLNSPCVFIGNHMSNLETLLLPGIVRPFMPVTFVVKDSLLTYPIFSAIMKSRNPIAVTRTDPKKDLSTVINEGINRIQNNISIIVFPQSTRSFEFSTDKFNSIGCKLAQRAEVPVIPIALKTDMLNNGLLFKDFGKIDISKPVHIAFGEPLNITGNGKETHSKVCEFIKDNLSSWS